MAERIDYPCPECGFDGPHPVLESCMRPGDESPTYLVECGDSACAVEFELGPVEE